MSTPAEVATRRATVRRLAQSGASSRRIADELGVSKDTVLRDLRQPEAPTMSRLERLAQRAAQTDTAVRHLSAAVQGVIDVRPAYTFTDDATAARWCGALRTAAAQLLAHADAFADLYPSATVADDAPQEAS